MIEKKNVIEINTELLNPNSNTQYVFVWKVFYEANDVQMKATQKEESVTCFIKETLGKLLRSSPLNL